MNRRLIRRIAFCLIALLGFAQGTVALAACMMERGGAMQADSAGHRSDCDMQPASGQTESPLPANLCAAHCTADLKPPGVPAVVVQAQGESQVLFAFPSPVERGAAPAAEVPPPQTVPPRILL